MKLKNMVVGQFYLIEYMGGVKHIARYHGQSLPARNIEEKICFDVYRVEMFKRLTSSHNLVSYSVQDVIDKGEFTVYSFSVFKNDQGKYEAL